MRLVISKVRAKSSLGRGVTPAKAVVNLTTTDKAFIKGLKPGKKLYFYVQDDGALGKAGLFSEVLDSTVYLMSGASAFEDRASALFEASGHESLKGCRINPTYMEITRVSSEGSTARVKGTVFNAYDPVLGERFDPSHVRALYDGSYYYTGLSPMAADIKKVVEQQREHFNKMSEDTEAKRYLDGTANLLMPHAYEAFHKQDDLVYFITKKGQWVALNLAGNRALDAVDRKRLRKYMEEEGLSGAEGEQRLEQARKTFHKLPLYDRFDTKALLPLMQKELDKHAAADAAELERISTAEPKYNELEPIPGLKEGVEFPPHQIYLINKIKDRDRIMVDADPGAGKTVIFIADILYQFNLGKIRRPLVIVPDEDLASQVASEIAHFSELNPWIITTASVQKWKNGDLNAFLADANGAPENTVFITTYNWISREKNEIESGHVNLQEGKYTYSTTDVFHRCYKLLQDLGVDAVYLDECHLLKNESNKSMAASIFAKAKQVKAFTGTIMPGNLIDVLGPMGVVHSGVLGTADEFLNKHSPTATVNSYHDAAPKDIRKDLKEYGVPQVRATAWASLLPKTNRFYHYVEFNKNQEKAYESLLKNAIDEIEKDPRLKRMFETFKVSLDNHDEAVISPILLARFTPLEIFLNSPASASPYLKAILSGEDAKSPKVNTINSIVGKHLSNPDNGKVLIFTQYQEAAKNILENLDPHLKNQAAYYQGGMVDVLARFKNHESDLKILVGVDKTLRVGHNMQAANCIIHADTLWLSGDMKQREARAVRIKQTRDVDVHHIIVHNSNELLKNARILAQEHLIAKANSDFEDKEVVPQIDMTLAAMKSFRTLDKIDPYIKRQQKLADYQKEQGEKDKQIFGSRLVKPSLYPALTKGKKLAVVPSTENFIGNANDAAYLVEKELDSLPENPEAPKLLKFHLQNWDGHWLLTCFKSSDPQGFVRRLGFLLQTPYMYLELANKGGIGQTIQKIEDLGIDILNKSNLETGVFRVRSMPGHRGVMRELEQKSKQAVSAAVKVELEFHFGTIDGFPFIYSDSLKVGTKESQLLKKAAFKEGMAFWYLPVTRTKLTNALRKIQENFKDVRIADWQEFKTQVNLIFKLDLKDFDSVGQQ